MAFHQVWQAWAVVVFVPVVKRYSRAHSGTNAQCMYAGRGVWGDGKPFLEIQGAYREPWVGVKKPSVFLVHVSLSPAVLFGGCFSLDEGFSVVTTVCE